MSQKCRTWVSRFGPYLLPLSSGNDGLPSFLSQERLVHPDVAGSIDKALHILEGSPEKDSPVQATALPDTPLSTPASTSAASPTRPNAPSLVSVESLDAPVHLPVALQWHLNSSLMTAKFWEEARRRRDEVEQRWPVEPLWRNYRFADISQCASRTPECLFWGLPAVNQSHTRANKAYRKCCVEHGKLRATVGDVFQALTRAQIPFWLGMGTLLGAVRNNGTIIAWDTDVDIYISEEDEAKLLELVSPQGSTLAGHYFERDHSPKRRPMYWIYYESTQVPCGTDLRADKKVT